VEIDLCVTVEIDLCVTVEIALARTLHQYKRPTGLDAHLATSDPRVLI